MGLRCGNEELADRELAADIEIGDLSHLISILILLHKMTQTSVGLVPGTRAWSCC